MSDSMARFIDRLAGEEQFRPRPALLARIGIAVVLATPVLLAVALALGLAAR